jgi:serine/threonine protein kinase
MEDVLREVEVLSKLWHKNIVEFVGCCVDLPHLAIAMQYAHKGLLICFLLLLFFFLKKKTLFQRSFV